MLNVEPSLETRSSFHTKKLLPIQMAAKIEIELVGLLAKTTLTQTFTNTSDEPVEAIHSIPIPVESALVNFSVRKNQQAWSGKVLPKSQADEVYEERLENGDSAFQLKRSKEDLLTLSLGNLLSKETLSIELEIVFPVQWYAGQGQLYLPLIMGARYGQSNLLPEEDITHSFLAEYPLELTLTLPKEFEGVKVESPSHPIQKVQKVQRQQEQEHKESSQYCLSGKGFLDRDLKILFHHAKSMEPLCQVVKTNQHGQAGLITLVTEPDTQTDAEERDILFVLDCSGSMQGTPMTQLKKVMSVLLNQMRPQDGFNIYPFGSTVEAMFEQTVPASKQFIVDAKRQIRRNMDADLGGTETVNALLKALSSHHKTRPTDIILITDGNVWFNEDSVEMQLLNAYANQHNVRLFTIGVGHAATEQTVKYLAGISGGSYMLTNPNEDIQFQVEAQFKRIFNQPLEIHVKTEHSWLKLPTAYQGDAIQIPVWFEQKTEFVEVTLHSKDKMQSYQLPAKKLKDLATQKWIAQQRYTDLPESDKESFAVDYQLLTDTTDYLVEMERAEGTKTDHIPGLVKMPQMMVREMDSNYLDIPAFMRIESGQSPYDGQPCCMSISSDVDVDVEIDTQRIEELKALEVYVMNVQKTKSKLDYGKLEILNIPTEGINRLRLIELEGLYDEMFEFILMMIEIERESVLNVSSEFTL